jgi:hypothetical protein
MNFSRLGAANPQEQINITTMEPIVNGREWNHLRMYLVCPNLQQSHALSTRRRARTKVSSG